MYGQEFLILDGETKVNPKNDVVWESIAYILKGGDYNSQTFSLEDYDLKENTTYRLIKKYKIEGYDDNYSVYFDFKIDKSKIKGITLTKDSEVWTHKECVISDDIPIYLLGEDNTLYSKISMNSSNVIKNWYEVCKLEEFKITKDDFKGLSKGKWHINGESIDKIIAGNKIALRYIEDNNGNFDYFLRQNDGTVYYVKGWSGVNGLYQISKMDVS